MNSTTFRTEIKLNPVHPIGLDDSILTTGSCFADQFGSWLSDFKFNILINPFGTTYNPISIHKNLINAFDGTIREHGFVKNQDIWHHLDFHSRWSALEKKDLIDSLVAIQKKVKEHVESTTVLIVTYGTAWVYSHHQEQEIVSNCHRLPSVLFSKRLLHPAEIATSFKALHFRLKQLSPKLRIILTVSPVRHLKDTLELNSVSKAILRLACHQASEEFDEVDYFPSYEIMMDDLRDYRFYERDRIHPTEEAIDYISQKFSDQYFTTETQAFIHQWDGIRRSLQHRAYHPDSAAHQYFLKDLLNKVNAFQGQVNIDQEVAHIKSQIHSNA